MEVVKLCTEAKKRCIYAVSKELGIDVDWNGLDGLSDEEASTRIDKLKTQLEKSDTRPDKEKTEEFNQWRFGMVVKIIFDKYPYLYLKAKPDVFTQEVRKVYDMVAKAEGELRNPSLEQAEYKIPGTILEDMKRTRKQSVEVL